jgi:hypothetical protein
MKYLSNENGIALVTALMMTLICLGISMAMLYMVLQGTELSGAQKRYMNTREATVGGVEIVTMSALPYLVRYATETAVVTADMFKTNLNSTMALNTVTTGDDACLKAKLTTRESQWPASCNRSVDAKAGPDLTFLLQSQLANAPSGYKIYTKIISTSPGATDMSGRDLRAESTYGGSEDTIGAPYIYRLEVAGENAANPKERANLSVLYAY